MYNNKEQYSKVVYFCKIFDDFFRLYNPFPP